MNPCGECLKAYGDFLCKNLGNCIFEDSGETPTLGFEGKPLVDVDKIILQVLR